MLLLSLLLILTPLHAGKIPCKWSGVEKIVAVADIHGDYENFEKILRGTGLVDENNDWIGGKTHLVQLGDILDRGDRAKEAFDLLMKLEKQAEAAGGMVHVLIGNHEESNITGIVFDQARYLTVPQLKAILPDDYIEKWELPIIKKYGSDGKAEEKKKEFWEKEINTARSKTPGAHTTRDKYTHNFLKKYGGWLLTKNLVIKINENLFVHGGLSDDFLDKDLETINNEARREFRVVAEWAAGEREDLALGRDPKYLTRPRAPHWYRGWARDPEDGNSAILEGILATYKAKRMIIGHTVRNVEFIETRELARFGGRVWAIDVGISDYYNDVLCALIIQKKRIQIIFKEYEVSTLKAWWGDDEKE